MNIYIESTGRGKQAPYVPEVITNLGNLPAENVLYIPDFPFDSSGLDEHITGLIRWKSKETGVIGVGKVRGTLDMILGMLTSSERDFAVITDNGHEYLLEAIREKYKAFIRPANVNA